MRRKSFAVMRCSIARALDLVGEWWTMLVVREAFMGTTRFDAFQRNLGIAPNILSARLKRLVASGVLQRMPAGGARRQEYRLTEKGRDLFPVLVALLQWGDRWLAGPDGPPVRLLDRAAGLPVAVGVRSSDGRTLRPTDIRLVPGPGARDATRRRFADPSGGAPPDG
jgi:DNA-binding HxlR family transcriptional regulator